MPTETQLPKTVRDDRRVAELRAEGWVFHANFDPKKPGDLEETLRTSASFYLCPSNAREVLLYDRAYGLDDDLQPGDKAIYMRNFRKPQKQ